MTLTANRPEEVPDTATLSRFCEELAEDAREIALTYFRRSVSYERKADLSPVTVADQAIEKVLRERIQRRFPDHGIVGEEEEDKPGARFTWYIDPIDGTKSFITGMPLFGTLVALYDARQEAPILGMIDMPALDERWIGDGTVTYLNGTPARASDCLRIEEAQAYTSSPDFFSDDDWTVYDRLSRKAAFRRFGGDCYIYALLASGFCDLVVEASLKSFDYMALVPVVEGAGGVIRDWQGAALTPRSDGRVVAAATEDLLRQALLDTRKASARPS
jgi:histidinol phosphatase-like enzyme (inositol monophosphatase family)